MTILTRMGVSDSYTAILPNGDHLTLWPDYSAERVSFTPIKTRIVPTRCNACVACCMNRCRDPAHQPTEVEYSVCKVVARSLRQPTVADALKIIAPGVDFGVRPDGTFPVRAYMQYSEADKRVWPRIVNDLPENTP